MDLARVFAYDVGFSFSGEARPLVEAINSELKAEDVITFYDFDQQAVLLALDLQPTLESIYTESCRYYWLFVWTRLLRRRSGPEGSWTFSLIVGAKGTSSR